MVSGAGYGHLVVERAPNQGSFPSRRRLPEDERERASKHFTIRQLIVLDVRDTLYEYLVSYCDFSAALRHRIGRV